MKRNLIFMDGEFTKLKTTGIDFLSIALITESGKELYLEIKQNLEHADKWVIDNVCNHLTQEKVTEPQAREAIRVFLEENNLYFDDDFLSKPVIVADVNQFDWNGLCTLFGLWNVPFFYIPIDFSTILFTKSIDIDVSREKLAESMGVDITDFKKHHALHDARIMKAMFEKLQERNV